MTTTATAKVSVKDIELFADDLDPRKAAEVYREHGALVIRGLIRLVSRSTFIPFAWYRIVLAVVLIAVYWNEIWAG